MAKVLSQLSSSLRFGHIPTHNLLEQLFNLEERYEYIQCVNCHWDIIKCFNSSQTLFLRKEYNLFREKKIDLQCMLGTS